MKLKDYQERALREIKVFLEQLVVWRDKARDGDEWLFDFAEKAWEKAEVGGAYAKRRDGLGRPLPWFGLKVPTGGGKTLLAVETIGLLQNVYRRRANGLVVWIVPTLQIYRQTLAALKDRDHPYRQHLDIVSGGRTLILEKTDGFTPQDIEEHLAVLMLMLPSASRANKEALRMFRDSGAFQAFFPPEEDREGHRKLLARIPNLEAFEAEDVYGVGQVKTSLGNTIRLLEPALILDEGHRAYGVQAQETLRGLNPCAIVEMSATPPKESNKLVVIGGQDLLREEMIKLDLHVWNKSSVSWRDTMLAAMQRRDALEAKAQEYEANTNVPIRPICLVQVERTGRDQRDGRHIHAEDVREYLLGQGVQKDWIAVKTAEVDEIKDYDDLGGLMGPDCPIRYIITKQALQEGWDCSYAYVLAVLTNPQSKTALTQLIGRILRQPYARKTHIAELDESYVYCFQRNRLLDEIREGFRTEGLEDMQGRVAADAGDGGAPVVREVGPRKQFAKAAARLVLPAFVIRDGKDWRLVSYEADILSRIPWEKADISPLYGMQLSLEERRDIEIRTGLADGLEGLKAVEGGGDAAEVKAALDYAYAAAHLLDVVPNPWWGYKFVEDLFGHLQETWKGKGRIVANNVVFILEELHRRLGKERDRLAEAVFNDLLAADKMRFMVVADDLGMNRLPRKAEIPQGTVRATKLDGSQFELNLFDPVPADSLNEFEREVATFLEEQGRLYFWYRNLPLKDYFVQGWQRSRIFADFIFTVREGAKGDTVRQVFVLETKGKHLKNEDTAYKKSVFALCSEHAQRKTWNQLVPAMQGKDIRFEVVFQDEWQKRLIELLNED